MNITCTHQTEVVCSMRLLKIDGCSPYGSRSIEHDRYIASRWEISRYEWEVRFYPAKSRNGNNHMALQLVFLSQQARANEVTANIRCRLVDPSGTNQPSAEQIGLSKSFQAPSDSSEILHIMTRTQAHESGYFKGSSVAVECTVTLFKDPEDTILQSFDLHKHLGDLFRSGTGADVTFVVSGESVAAHKNILAARTPVFMAEFFGGIKEKTSRCIEIKEMEPEVFKAMLHFIYTDTVPELDEKHKTAIDMTRHLLVAADRYALDRLKLICGRRIARSINASTVATTLALAEQHGCSQLKAKCVEFITGGSAENLDAVLATDGFKPLEAGNPSVLTELLKAAHKRINN